jgi:predicted secreted protein
MKLVAKGLPAIFLVCFFANSGCGQAKPDAKLRVINLSVGDSGKTLTIAKSRVFTLTLSDHIDGGYRFDKAVYDTTALHLDKYTEKPPAANSSVGASGVAVWQFTVLTKGKTAL